MAKRILKIALSKGSYETWHDTLKQFFVDKGLPEPEAMDKVKSILDEAQSGWPRAPRDIETRIKMKSGYQWKSHNNLNGNADTIPNVIRHREKVNKTIRDMYQWENNMSDDEMKWFKNREAQYLSEFEFNESSDKPLLFQLLIEELTQRRLAALILRNPKEADSYSKLMTESLKRLQDTQTKLGITREQRADLLDNRAGDISSLSLDLDAKIKKIGEKMEEWKKESSKYKFLREQQGPINLLPPLNKIEALLNIDNEGNLGKDINTDDVSELIEKTVEEAENKPYIKAHGDESKSETDESGAS